MSYSKRLEVLQMPKTKEVLMEIERIHYEHRFDAGAMFDTLTADEARRAYNNLIAKLPSIPELTDEERSILQKEIEKRISGVDAVEKDKVENPSLAAEKRPYYLGELLTKTKAEQLQDAVAWVKEDYDVGFSSMPFESLSEVKHAYKQLTSILDKIPGITQEDKERALAQIKANEKEIAKKEEIDIE